jgi:hypothetical protein
MASSLGLFDIMITMVPMLVAAVSLIAQEAPPAPQTPGSGSRPLPEASPVRARVDEYLRPYLAMLRPTSRAEAGPVAGCAQSTLSRALRRTS